MQSILTQLANLQSNLSSFNTPPQATNSCTTSHEPLHNSPPQQDLPNTPVDVKPHEELIQDFLEPGRYGELASFLSSCIYRNENGHSVAAYGERYFYTGSKADTAPTAELPDILEKVMKYVGEKCDCEVNSVLINYYPASDDSYLPEHSDDESSIDPESVICTFSVGGSRTLTFKERCSGSETTLCAVDNSLYYMSRHSQNFFSHRIDKAPVCTDRYSLTFRLV